MSWTKILIGVVLGILAGLGQANLSRPRVEGVKESFGSLAWDLILVTLVYGAFFYFYFGLKEVYIVNIPFAIARITGFIYFRRRS